MEAASPVELEATLPDALSMNEASETKALTENRTASSEASGDHLEHSDAHFQSEQDLFTGPSSTPEAGQDFVDVATFLEMGHVPNCWCRPCQDMYDHDIDIDNDLPDLIDADDEWLVCSSASGTRSPSSCSAWEWEWGTLVDEESDFAGVLCSGKETSDDEWKCMSPSVKAQGAW